MNVDQWFALAGVIVAALALIGGFFYWKDGKKEAATATIREELFANHVALRESITVLRSELQTSIIRNTAEHDMLRTEYVNYREFDSQMKNVDRALTDTRADINAVGVQVGKVHERIDRLIDKRTGDDG